MNLPRDLGMMSFHDLRYLLSKTNRVWLLPLATSPACRGHVRQSDLHDQHSKLGVPQGITRAFVPSNLPQTWLMFDCWTRESYKRFRSLHMPKLEHKSCWKRAISSKSWLHGWWSMPQGRGWLHVQGHRIRWKPEMMSKWAKTAAKPLNP